MSFALDGLNFLSWSHLQPKQAAQKFSVSNQAVSKNEKTPFYRRRKNILLVSPALLVFLSVKSTAILGQLETACIVEGRTTEITTRWVDSSHVITISPKSGSLHTRQLFQGSPMHLTRGKSCRQPGCHWFVLGDRSLANPCHTIDLAAGVGC